MGLKVDSRREGDVRHATGICVRAQNPDGSWASADIYELTKGSLLEWLRSRGGENPLAENVVGVLLGHGHLHAVAESPQVRNGESDA